MKRPCGRQPWDIRRAESLEGPTGRDHRRPGKHWFAIGVPHRITPHGGSDRSGSEFTVGAARQGAQAIAADGRSWRRSAGRIRLGVARRAGIDGGPVT